MSYLLDNLYYYLGYPEVKEYNKSLKEIILEYQEIYNDIELTDREKRIRSLLLKQIRESNIKLKPVDNKSIIKFEKEKQVKIIVFKKNKRRKRNKSLKE